jgi:AraC-like DNA-binding protein
MLAATRRSAEFTTGTRRWLLATPGRFPPFEEAAAMMHMSPRTLRRRLSEEGTTYQEIVHELRRQLAETYLRGNVLTVTEIAEMLGYTDVSNFRRAFVAWTGSSPAAYRRQLRSPGPEGLA